MQPGDAVLRLNGRVPRDVIEWRLWSDEPDVDLLLSRNGIEVETAIAKPAGQPLGAEVSSAVFDRVRTCDNHCEFCFIYQLPKGMRRSLYLKDDDYRLSFLYGNFTTLTRFTEADLERVVTERLSPLHVSIHSTDPELRATMLRNRRGATSLRWLRALLDHGIEVRGQLVVCPGVNDGARLDDTLAGILDEYPELATVAVVPLGISRFNPEANLREHTVDEARAVIDAVEDWQDVYLAALGHRLVHAADEYYLMAGREFPPDRPLRGLPDARGRRRHGAHLRSGVPSVGPATSPGRSVASSPPSTRRATRRTTARRARASGPRRLPSRWRRGGRRRSASSRASWAPRCCSRWSRRSIVADVRVIPVVNEFFGGNTGVSGLMVGADLTRVLADEPAGHRYLLPDVCLSDDGRFLDGGSVDGLPRPVEVIATDGRALRDALGERSGRALSSCHSSPSSAGRTSASRRCSTASSASRRRSSRITLG